MSRQEIIDKILGKTVSKTLMVTLIATFGLFYSKLSGMESSIKIKQGQIDFTGLVLPYKSYVAILNQTIIK